MCGGDAAFCQITLTTCYIVLADWTRTALSFISSLETTDTDVPFYDEAQYTHTHTHTERERERERESGSCEHYANDLCKGGGRSDAFQDDDVGARRANLVERGSEMNRERAAELTGGDLAVMTACSALTHVTTSSRASAIFVSRDAQASTGYNDVTHVHHHQYSMTI